MGSLTIGYGVKCLEASGLQTEGPALPHRLSIPLEGGSGTAQNIYEQGRL